MDKGKRMLIPAEYLEVYNLCSGHNSAQIARLVNVPLERVLVRLVRLEQAGFIARDVTGGYVQVKPFDALEISRLQSHGWSAT